MKIISKGTLCHRFSRALFILLIGVFGANTFTSCSSDSSGGEETPSSSSVEGTPSSSSEGSSSSSSLAASSSSGGGSQSSSSNGGNSVGGTFTLTDIPAQYNGNYAGISVGYNQDRTIEIAGGRVDMSIRTFYAILISNGTVSVPVLVEGNSGFSEYTGDDIFDFQFQIIDSEVADGSSTYGTKELEGEELILIQFNSVTFTNGNATKSWNEGSIVGTSSSSGVGTLSSSSTEECSEGELSGSFIDNRDNKSYNWVRICNQIWMAENLNYSGDNEDIGVCYEGVESNCDKYGRLYDWNTALDACPDDWHLPRDDEWTILIDFVGEPAGAKLKAISGWGDYNGTNNYGFEALPGGYGHYSDGFESIDRIGYWWSATEDNANTNYAWYRSMRDSNNNASRSGSNKANMRSVRCVKDNQGGVQ